MHHLGEKIIVVGDAFEQNLPVGEYGYIIAYDRNPDNAFDYIVRAPKTNRNYCVPSSDIETEDRLIKLEAERIEREVLIDYALATHNERMFKQIMNGEVESDEDLESSTQEAMSQADFIKQVNLRAWI